VTILLDTCAAIWLVAGSKVSQPAEEALNAAWAAGEPVYISPITAWEVGLLAQRGRFASPHPPKVWFDRLLAIDGVALDLLPPSVLTDSSFLPGEPPTDPADRIVVAAAREHDHIIMTRDRIILDYAKAGHVRALEC
jgi:PIN domain nuclease of toxin-antitoxin system